MTYISANLLFIHLTSGLSMLKTVIVALLLLLTWQLGLTFLQQFALMNVLDGQAWQQVTQELWWLPLINNLVLVLVFVALSLLLSLGKRHGLMRAWLLLATSVLSLLLLVSLGMLPWTNLWRPMHAMQWGQWAILLFCFSYLLPREANNRGWFVNR